MLTQQTRDIEAMLGQCWADVVDGGPTLNQHWFNVSCLLGTCSHRRCNSDSDKFIRFLTYIQSNNMNRNN